LKELIQALIPLEIKWFAETDISVADDEQLLLLMYQSDCYQLLIGLESTSKDCLVGINLLREGLDLPEVSLVAILDADKEGFLRSATSLIQVAGRAARNLNGTVIMYADTITKSMQKAIDEGVRRRKIQLEFNKDFNITPRSIEKAIKQGIEDLSDAEEFVIQLTGEQKDEYELKKYISELEYEMELAARNLDFEKAARLRDKIKEFKGKQGVSRAT